jgi:PKD repeat protein
VQESGPPVTIFTFDATSSSDEEDLPATLLVRWDWESDGIFDTDFSTNKSLDHHYTGVGTYKITLEVMDSENLGNSKTKTLFITGTVTEVTTDSISSIT